MRANRSTLAPDHLQETLDAARNGARKGDQQYFTPPAFAHAFAALLPKTRPVIVDLSCGAGALLAAAANESTRDLLGVDLDPRAAIPKVEFQGEKISRVDRSVLHGDLTEAFPLLRETKFRGDLFYLNPPYSLEWHAERFACLYDSEIPAVVDAIRATVRKRKVIDSTLATFLMALDLMTERGEGAMICNQATATRLFLNQPPQVTHRLSSHIWAWLTVPNFFPGVSDETEFAILYFAREENSDDCATATASAATVEAVQAALAPIVAARQSLRPFAINHEYYAEKTGPGIFEAVRGEVSRRAGKRKTEFNLWLDAHGFIRRHLTPFQECSERIPRELIKELNDLGGQTPMSLVVQKPSRLALLRAVRSEFWIVDPKLTTAVDAALSSYNAVRAPFVPLNDVQRIGYLDEEDSIVCQGDGLPAFTPGKRYALASRTIDIKRIVKRANLAGKIEEIEVNGHDLLLEITGDDGAAHAFTSEPKNEEIKVTGATFDLAALVANFEIPEVPDIAAANQEAYRANLDKIRDLEVFLDPLKFRHYQREDLARAALSDGLVLAWEQGLGKGVAMFALPLIKGARRALIVAPGSLHAQIIKEARDKFKVDVRPLLSQADFHNDDLLQGREKALPGAAGSPFQSCQFWITTYQALGYNGADEWGPKEDEEEISRNRRDALLGERRVFSRYGSLEFRSAFAAALREISEVVTRDRAADPAVLDKIAKLQRLAACENSGGFAAYATAQPGEIANCLAMIAELRKKYGVQTITETVTRQACDSDPREWFDHVGTERTAEANETTPAHKVRCIFLPTLARLINTLPAELAFDQVVIDEGVRLKASESYVSQGVRELSPRFRLVLTGTPIKNVLIDLFWLAHWACGGHDLPTARFPYENADAARERFANEYMLTERNLTREQEAQERTGRRTRYVKRTPEICNIHRLWKTLGPIVLRRRKDECGETLVSKTIVPIRVKPGTAQQAVYSRYLLHKPVAAKHCSLPAQSLSQAEGRGLKGGAAIGMQLQLLRQAALCPDSPLLMEAILPPEASELPKRSWTDLNPKSAAILSLVVELLEKGQQVVVMSPFCHFSQTLQRRLNEAGVSNCLLDGGTSPLKRGRIAAEFKAGKYAVMIGGIESMSEGHSLECCSNLVLPSLTWAYDKNAQAVERVHRLNSTRPVTIYAMVCENTIDVRLESLFREKADSSNLALDGRLHEEKTGEINLAQLLADAIENFDPNAETIDEQGMENEWSRLRERLRNAQQVFHDWHPPILRGPIDETPVTVADLRIEAAAIDEALAAPLLDAGTSAADKLSAALAALMAL